MDCREDCAGCPSVELASSFQQVGLLAEPFAAEPVEQVCAASGWAVYTIVPCICMHIIHLMHST
jgi:hypothetical protein